MRRLLGVVDSDSYVKWGAALLSHLPSDEWSIELVTVASRLAASETQLEFALAGSRFTAAPHATLQQIVDRLNSGPYDAVFVSTSGAASEAVITEVTQKVARRPVIMTGLPGISYPAKYKGLFRRAQADLFVLHSHREIREYERLAASRGMSHNFVLATLPFLEHVDEHEFDASGRDSIVFAAQPGVPWELGDRQKIVDRLVETARAHPELRVVIKVRAQAGERQTHREKYPYPELVPHDAPGNLVVEGGAMSDHLARAVGFVTVSSTAAIEAIAARVPSLTLDDFGVSAELINLVFVDSGLLGPTDDLVAADFHTVDANWRRDNYFHPISENDWQRRLAELTALRDAGELPARPAQRRSRGGAIRRAWDRKRAFGPYDRTVAGYLAAAVGYPVLFARDLMSTLRGGAAPSRTVDGEANDDDAVTTRAGRG